MSGAAGRAVRPCRQRGPGRQVPAGSPDDGIPAALRLVVGRRRAVASGRLAGSQHGKVAVVAALVAAYAAAWTVPEMVRPEAGLEYRKAYKFVQRQKATGDAVFAQMAVVYQTYYGKDADVLKDEDLPEADRVAGEKRLWAVFGAGRLDLRRRLESAGGHIALEHRVGGLVVLLYVPRSSSH